MAHPDDDRIVDGHIDEGTVHAWLDGQLLADDAARVESHVAACGPCAAQVAEARGFIAASSRILTALDGVPARVLPERRRRVQLWQVRAAAAVVIVALGTATVLHNVGSPALRPRLVASLADTVRPVTAPPAARGASAVGGKEADKPAAPSAAPALAAAPSNEGASREEARASALSKRAQRAAEPSAAQRMRDEADLAAAAPPQMQNKADALERGVAGGAPAVPSSQPSAAGAGAGGAAGVTGGVTPEPVPPPAPATAGAISSSSARAKSVQPQGMRADANPRNAVADSVAALRDAQKMAVAAPAGAERDITGRVIDADRKAPLGAALVAVVGSPNRVVTDDSGLFQLRVPATKVTITARRIGYTSTNAVVAANQREATIAMTTKRDGIDAVQITGEQMATTSTLGQSRLGVQTSSVCVGQTVMIASSVTAGDEKAALAVVRLDSAASTDSLYPGFALSALSDTGAAPAGAWTPLGPDSAIVSVPSDARRAAGQTESADAVARAAARDREIVRTRVRCARR